MALVALRRFEVAGLRVALRADDPLPLPLRELLGRLARLSPGTGPPALRYDLLLRPARKRVVRDGRSIYAGRLVRDAVDALEFDLLVTLAARAAATPLHAAALAHAGRGLLLAGASGAGKSSLTRALLARGARYLGDEHAFLHEDLAVQGLPRAIAVEGAPPLLPPAERVEHRPVPVRLVALLETPRRADAGPTPLPPAQAAARLLAAIYRPPRPEDLRRVTRLAAQVPVVELRREGVEAAAGLLLEALPG